LKLLASKKCIGRAAISLLRASTLGGIGRAGSVYLAPVDRAYPPVVSYGPEDRRPIGGSCSKFVL